MLIRRQLHHHKVLLQQRILNIEASNTTKEKLKSPNLQTATAGRTTAAPTAINAPPTAITRRTTEAPTAINAPPTAIAGRTAPTPTVINAPLTAITTPAPTARTAESTVRWPM
ncbi:hypothetical protein FRB93_012229 [Tulasnella sp. JGI-2019a]|nr:hypothetical protein FRB93_012229 [Tulasnella sp. JGI-2019a]